eukprot:3820143-Alexandrium_andersonii.AAC.1
MVNALGHSNTDLQRCSFKDTINTSTLCRSVDGAILGSYALTPSTSVARCLNQRFRQPRRRVALIYKVDYANTDMQTSTFKD